MKLILRNLMRIFRRFRTAMILNILGLAVAFTAFMLLMMQWDYDRQFDRHDPNADNGTPDESRSQVVLMVSPSCDRRPTSSVVAFFMPCLEMSPSPSRRTASGESSRTSSIR